MAHVELGSKAMRPYRVGLGLQISVAAAVVCVVLPIGFLRSASDDGLLAGIGAVLLGEALMVPGAAWFIWCSRIGVWVSAVGVRVRSPRTTRFRWDEVEYFYVDQLSNSRRPFDRFVAAGSASSLEAVAVRLSSGDTIVLGSLNSHSAAVLGGSPPSEIVEALNGSIPRAPSA